MVTTITEPLLKTKFRFINSSKEKISQTVLVPKSVHLQNQLESLKDLKVKQYQYHPHLQLLATNKETETIEIIPSFIPLCRIIFLLE